MIKSLVWKPATFVKKKKRMKGRERKKERKGREGETEGQRKKKVLVSREVYSEGSCLH